MFWGAGHRRRRPQAHARDRPIESRACRGGRDDDWERRSPPRRWREPVGNHDQVADFVRWRPRWFVPARHKGAYGKTYGLRYVSYENTVIVRLVRKAMI